MPCPFFVPGAPLESWAGVVGPRMPLGDAYGGTCCAVPHEIADEQLRDVCNQGYARGRCSHFPQDCREDAVRFSIISEDGGRLRLVYIKEAANFPVEHGVLEYTVLEYGIAESQLDCGQDSPMAAQAQAFVESYLRRVKLCACT